MWFRTFFSDPFSRASTVAFIVYWRPGPTNNDVSRTCQASCSLASETGASANGKVTLGFGGRDAGRVWGGASAARRMNARMVEGCAPRVVSRVVCVVENEGRHTVYGLARTLYEKASYRPSHPIPPPAHPPNLVRTPPHGFTSLRIFFTIGALSLTLALITGGGDGQRTSIVFSLGMNAAVVCCLCTLLLAGLVLVSAGFGPTPTLQCVVVYVG